MNLCVTPRVVGLGAGAAAGSLALALAATPAHAAPAATSSMQAAPRAAETPPASYTVVSGDTVSAIAARFGLRTQDVLSANGLGWSSIIRPGQVLALSAPAAPAALSEAASAEPAASATATHTVVSGDTVSAIAAAGGTTVAAVLSANGLSWDSIIYPGQVLAVPTGDATAALGLDAEQIANARIIITVGRELGVPDRGIQIALGTAMQESWLRNLGWGDRDSLGLFQQRPSAGWGTAEQVTDPDRATRAFYGGASDPNGTATRGLLDVPGWESLSFADAAQAVQVSAYPDRYAQWEAPASVWLSVLG